MTDGDSPTATSVNIDPEHPWLGLSSYTEETRAYFHGRDEEAAEFLLMGLRLVEGLDLVRYAELAGRPLPLAPAISASWPALNVTLASRNAGCGRLR